tara:strand:- start:1236 stop:1628 length:393 start_codon:yes stop_codon:yes gene_type:complete
MSKNNLSNDLQLLKSSLLKVFNKINGDDFNNSIIGDIKILLNRIDKNPESHNIDKTQFDKLILLYTICCSVLFRTSEYTRDLQMRYTQDNVNKELLDKSLNDFKLDLPTQIIEEKEDTRNGAELIKDGVI